VSHGWPTIAGDAQRILFTVFTDDTRDPASAWALSVETGERTRIEEAAGFPHHAASGHLLFFRGGRCWRVRSTSNG
jgi:hypothetical protein